MLECMSTRLSLQTELFQNQKDAVKKKTSTGLTDDADTRRADTSLDTRKFIRHMSVGPLYVAVKKASRFRSDLQRRIIYIKYNLIMRNTLFCSYLSKLMITFVQNDGVR